MLFLDELPEFPRSALEALREPLETGCITISRAAYQALYPARFQLVAAMNPCPCGWLGASVAGRQCLCSGEAVRRYQARLSGPLLDRIDMQIEVPALRPADLLAPVGGATPGSPASRPESSATVAARVRLARDRQAARQGRPNALLAAAGLETGLPLAESSRSLLEQVADRLGWSARSLHRVTKVAMTVADLAGAHEVAASHMAEAVQYRRGLPGG